MFRRIRAAVEEVVHIVVGKLFQLCLANTGQDIHREPHPYTKHNRQQLEDAVFRSSVNNFCHFFPNSQRSALLNDQNIT